MNKFRHSVIFLILPFVGVTSCGNQTITEIDIKIKDLHGSHTSALVGSLNEEAEKASASLGYKFRFSVSENDSCDLWLNLSAFDDIYLENAYTPLPKSVQDSISNASYIKPVRQFLTASNAKETFIPLSYDFVGMGYEARSYKTSDLKTLDGVLNALGENHLFGGGEYYNWSLFTDNDHIHFGDWNKTDSSGTPLLASPSLEPFYVGINKALTSDPKHIFYDGLSLDGIKLGHLGDILYSEASEQYRIAPWPTIKADNEEIKTISWGYLYGASLDKSCSSKLNEKEISALCSILTNKDSKLWEGGKLPVIKESYGVLPFFDGDLDFIENRTVIFSGLETGFIAMSRFIREVATKDLDKTEKDYTFAARFEELYRSETK